MSEVNLKVKLLHPNAKAPARAHDDDACFDITCVDKNYDNAQEGYWYRLGFAAEIPPGHVGLLFPRSSVCKRGLGLANCVGVIDPGYRGEWMAFFRPTTLNPEPYQVGERILQLLILPTPSVSITIVDELSDTTRGQGGFGSSGRT
jgi:dUTP pyrophosphatase